MARILVDMDGVLANWGKQYDADLDARGEFAAGIPRTIDQRSFDLNEGRTEREVALIKAVMDRPGFYAELLPMPGAIQALREMVEAGHEVQICTSPWKSNRTCAQDKFDWIEDHLGADWLARVTMTHDKASVRGDILIDDRPDIHGAADAQWVQVLFDQPYNRDEQDAERRRRIVNWADWRSVIHDALIFDVPRKSAPSGEVRMVSSTGGEKGTKPQRYDLVPVMPMDKLAELYANGAAKYAAHNWRRGYDWSLSYAAAMRHMTRFWGGEDIDPEMQIPHPIAAVFHMFALTQFIVDFPEFDDRFKPVERSAE